MTLILTLTHSGPGLYACVAFHSRPESRSPNYIEIRLVDRAYAHKEGVKEKEKIPNDYLLHVN